MKPIMFANKIKLNRVYMMLPLLICTVNLTGCITLEKVEPWQKGNLARHEMKFDGDRLDLRYVDHTYFSKEASSGGSGVGAGGCGCN